MDLHFQGPEATPDEKAAVDSVLGPPASAWSGGDRNLEVEGRSTLLGGHAARSQRDRLLPVLHAVQSRFGWVPPGALDYVCRRLTIPPAEAYGVVTFYHLFSTTPQPPTVAHVCDDIACRIRGSESICLQLQATMGPEGESGWKRSPCLGRCEQAPVALVFNSGEVSSAISIAPATAASVYAARGVPDQNPPFETLRDSLPQFGDSNLRLLGRIGRVDPQRVDAYRENGGYAALKRAFEIGPAGVIAEVSSSKLTGRGGAAFPTGRKWAAVANAPGKPRYVVCNADESEPGTFKDRVLLEGDPFAVIEGMTIAGFATGSAKGYLYVRGEYPDAAARARAAIEAAYAAGLLGVNVMGSGFDFEIEMRIGAGAYICGEETALFESIEGKRGEPRTKPPFPVHVGLFGKPTLVNNVETLVNVPLILSMGGEAYARIGTSGSTGPKLFCVSGMVARPGVYEVDFGMTLGDLISLAGGVAGGRSPRAVLLGGAAGVFVGPEKLSMPLTLEDTRATGATLGSGVVLVLDDSVDLGDILGRIAAFFRDESCGQCVPCRVGTVRQEELIARLRCGQPLGSREDELTLFREIGQVMRDASICGLGQTAANAIESALVSLNLWPQRKDAP